MSALSTTNDTIKTALWTNHNRDMAELHKKRLELAKNEECLERQREWLTDLPDLPIPEPSAIYLFQILDELYVYYDRPGQAQEAANIIATEFGVIFQKRWNENKGCHTYSGRLFGKPLTIIGKPPDSCQIESYSETQTVTKFRVKCEEATR